MAMTSMCDQCVINVVMGDVHEYKGKFCNQIQIIRQRSSSCWLEESVHRECWQTERNVRIALVVGTDSGVWPPSHA